MDGNTILSPTIATRRRPFAPAKAGPPRSGETDWARSPSPFRRLDVSGKGAIDLDEVRRFRSLMASASEDSAVELDGRDRLTRALHLLDTVLDSPLDLDAPLFEAIGDVLFLEGTSPEQKENQPENITDLESLAMTPLARRPTRSRSRRVRFAVITFARAGTILFCPSTGSWGPSRPMWTGFRPPSVGRWPSSRASSVMFFLWHPTSGLMRMKAAPRQP